MNGQPHDTHHYSNGHFNDHTIGVLRASADLAERDEDLTAFHNERLAFAIVGALIAGGALALPNFMKSNWHHQFEGAILDVLTVLDTYNGD
jgi:hypothetical protein